MKTKDSVLLALLSIVAVLLFRDCSKSPEIVEVEKIVTDTVVQVKDSIVVKEKEVPVYYEKRINVPTIVYRDSSSGELHSHYSDTSRISDKFYLYYTADIVGRMDSISLGYYDDRPDSIEVRTVTNTVTTRQFISPKGFYWGGQVNTKGNIIPGAAYMWEDNVVLSGYNINTKSFTLGYFRKF